MQWSDDRNAGFSMADPQRLYQQPIMDPVYGYGAVNVESQARDPHSLLNWTRRLLAVRRSLPAFGRGSLSFLRPANRKVLAYVREYRGDTILCVANVARSAQPVELDLSRYKGRIPIELQGRAVFPPIGDTPYVLALAGHGFLWFRLALAAEVPGGVERVPPPLELPMLVLFDGWATLFRERVVPWRIALAERVRRQLEDEVLPPYLAARRWYAAKGERLARVAIADHAEWKRAGHSWLLALAHAERPGGVEPQTYFMPLALGWEERDEARVRKLAPAVIAKVRQQAEVGVLADALGDEAFVREVVAAIGAGEEVKTARGRIRFRPAGAFRGLAGDALAKLEVAIPAAQSSNSPVELGGRFFLKTYRRVQAGVNPEAEMGRFLTDIAHFPRVAPVAGTIEYATDDGRETTLALLQGYVENQGDAWQYAVGYLARFLEGAASSAVPPVDGGHSGWLTLIRTLGRRTAELHAALATRTGDPAFDPEPVRGEDIERWVQAALAEADRALDALARRRDSLAEPARAEAGLVLARADELRARIARHRDAAPAGDKTRIHGDYHLGQVLLAENDFVIIDFEGEPRKTLAERRAKQSRWRDVAGMLRSFDYARHEALSQARANGVEATDALHAAARSWLDRTVAAFLEAYATAGEARHADGLLELFALEKAFYELAYELDNRPDWSRIPLRGLLDGLTTGDAGGAQ